jgi:hypothetical protein
MEYEIRIKDPSSQGIFKDRICFAISPLELSNLMNIVRMAACDSRNYNTQASFHKLYDDMDEALAKWRKVTGNDIYD